MKRILFLLLSLFTGFFSNAQQIGFYKQIPLPNPTRREVVFDARLPLIIGCERTLFDLGIYIQNTETNTCDSFRLDVPGTIGKRESVFDVKIISGDSFYLLTNERLIRIAHKKGNYHVTHTEMLPQDHYTQIHLFKGQVFLSASFTPNARRTPKINIWNKTTDQHYRHFASCDPHAIYTGYNLVTLNSKGIFCVVKDNVSPAITFVDQQLKEIKTIDVLTAPNPAQIRDKACEFDRKYNAHGNQENFDSLNYYLRNLATIEKVIFTDTNKLLLVGMQMGKEDLDPFMQVITFDEGWNILSRTPVKVLPDHEEIKQAFSADHITLNPFGKTLKESSGMLIFVNKYIDLTRMKKVSDFYNAYGGIGDNGSYYLFKAK